MLNNLDTSQLNGVYLVCGYTDLRQGIDGLAGIIKHKYGLNPFDANTLFLFCGRKPDRVKGLLWEGDGFLLLYKRLENGRYQWSRNSSEVYSMSPRQYKWLMEGLSIHQKRYVKKAYIEHIL